MHKFVTPDTFVHRVQSDQFFKKKQSPESKNQKLKKTEQDFELYQNLKDYRNSNQLLKNKEKQVKLINPLSKHIDMMESKKQQQEKKMREAQFQLKKKSMLHENQQKLQSDLRNLDKISVSAFKDFKEQVNLYNKYYSSTIGQEPQITEIQHEDLNIPYQYIEKDDKYTYRNILNYSIPEINYSNEQAKSCAETILSLKFSDEELENKLLNRLRNQVKVRKLDQEEEEYFQVIKNNDLTTLKLMLLANDQLVHARDPVKYYITQIGQTGLHFAAKRNYYDICQELLNNGIDIFVTDYASRTARMLADKYNYFKVAKLIQMEEDAQTKKRHQQ